MLKQARLKLCSSALMVVLGAGTALAGQSLAAVAKAESERRKTVTEPAKVYTNEDVEKAASPLTTGASAKPRPSTDTSATGAPAAGGATPPAAGGAAEANKPDEAAWRARMAAAREALAKAEAFDRALQSQINGLWADFTARDNPVERSKIEKDRGEAMAEQDRVKKEVVSRKKEVADIEDEARRSGVPPGWLR